MFTIPHSGVWGWPWHGLATNGSIAGSGKGITQPPNSSAWLIDLGLPAISLSSAESAAATANNYEWRNYAMISGGRLYDTALPPKSWIYIDSADTPYLVTASWTFSTDYTTADITLQFTRFGLFGSAAPAPHSATQTVTLPVYSPCPGCSISYALPNWSTYSSGYYLGDLSAKMSLEDVWTNGTRALIASYDYLVGAGASSYTKRLFHVFELTLSGSGGSITFSIDRIRDDDETTWTNIADDIVTDGYTSYEKSESVVARMVRYDDSGDPYTLRHHLFFDRTTSRVIAPEGVPSYSGSYFPYTETAISEILQNSTSVLVYLSTVFDEDGDPATPYDPELTSATGYAASWALAYESYPNDTLKREFSYSLEPGPFTGATDTLLQNRWISSIGDVVATTGFVVLNGCCCCYTLLPNGTTTFSDLITPIGNQTVSAFGLPFYTAWNRKTGNFSFGAAPICYV